MKKLTYWIALWKLFQRPGFWLITAILVLLTIPHYREAIAHPNIFNEMMVVLGLNRHAFERILFLLPIISAGFIFGWQGTVVVSIISLLCMLPRVFFLSKDFGDAIFETAAVFFVGNAVAVSFVALRKEREHRIRLSVLDKIATAVSQSLELSQVLNASVDSVIKVMNIDAVLIFLYDKEQGILKMACYKGVSDVFVHGVDNLKLGEGINGAVALSGEPEYIENVMEDPRLTKKEAVSFEKLCSHFIVPLKSKNKVMGTLCIATRNKYRFKKEEMETAIAIGNQIGVAVDNAVMYEKEKKVAQQLKASEERYRNLFENAHDAIWLQDMGDNIIAANKACARLTGYSLVELYLLPASELLSPESRNIAASIRNDLLDRPGTGTIYEVRLIKKDKSEVIVQLASSLFSSDAKPWAFQLIARDITQEKRMQENLRFYLQQVTQAQEEERKRIARELHDDTIQSLVVLARKIDEITYSSSELSIEKRRLLDNLREETNNVMSGVRRLSQDLRPPTLDKLGLIPTLEWLSSSIQDISGISIRLKISGFERRLPTEVELVLYRIIQESLRNVWKHSGASEAEVIVEFSDNLTKVCIKDNGKGFEFKQPPEDLARYGKLGLAGIKERVKLLGGFMKIESSLGEGTIIEIEVPI